MEVYNRKGILRLLLGAFRRKAGATLEKEGLGLPKGRSRALFAAGLALVMVTGLPAARAGSAPVIEPEAAQTLKAVLDRIAGASSFTYRAEVTSDTALPSGQKIQFSGTLEVAVRRPDAFWSSFDGEQRTIRSWYDGKTFTLLDNGKNVYACWPSPGKLDDLLRAMKDDLGFSLPLSPLLRESVSTKALARVNSGFTVGRSLVGGVPCRHLAFRGEKTDWQVWVTEDGEPVLKRIVITYKQEDAAPQYAATFLAWDFAPRLTDDAFRFTPPQGAIQCEFEQIKP